MPQLMTEMLLLAAGRSSRMGSPKGLLPLAGATFIEWQLERIRAAGVGRVRLVVGEGPEAATYQTLAQKILAPRQLLLVANLDSNTSPFDSLKLALNAAELRGPLFVLPLDSPAPTADLFADLHLALTAGVLAVQPSDGTRAGHPALLSVEFQERLVRVPTDSPEARLDLQLRKLGDLRRFVTTAAAEPFMNLNTLAAFQKFASELHIHA